MSNTDSQAAAEAQKLQNTFYRESDYTLCCSRPIGARERAISAALALRTLYLSDPLNPWVRQSWAQVESDARRKMIQLSTPSPVPPQHR